MKLCPLLLAAIASVLPAAFGAAPLAEWTFDQPGDLQGWQPNGDVADVSVANGALACRAIGSDPILHLQPLLAVTATPRQGANIGASMATALRYRPGTTAGGGRDDRVDMKASK